MESKIKDLLECIVAFDTTETLEVKGMYFETIQKDAKKLLTPQPNNTEFCKCNCQGSEPDCINIKPPNTEGRECDICKQPVTSEEVKTGHCFNCGEQDI